MPASQTSAVHPSLDLSAILVTLLSSSAFLVVPSPTYLKPTLPSVNITDVSVAPREKNAKVALSVEAELDRLKNGRSWLDPNSTSDDDEDSDEATGWLGNLEDKRLEYLNLKASLFPSDMSQQRRAIVTQAEGRTLRALKDAAPTAQGVVPDIMRKLDESGTASMRLFDIVGSGGAAASERVDKGLEAYQSVMSELV